MPVLHLPQLVGLALGLEPKELGHEQAHRPADVGDRLVDLGRGRRGGLSGARVSRSGGLIQRLRSALATALGRGSPAAPRRDEQDSREEVGRRIDTAQQRLKSTIPPPEE